MAFQVIHGLNMTTTQDLRSKRIYKPEEYANLFNPQAKDERLLKREAYDASNAIREKTERDLNDVQTIADGAARQATVDNVNLKAEQNIAKAQFDANWSAVKGILDFTKTAIGGAEKFGTIKADAAEDHDLWESTYNFTDTEGQTPNSLTTVQEDANDNSLIIGEAKATAQTAQGLTESGTSQNASIASILSNSTAFSIIQGVKGDVEKAKALHLPFLTSALASLPETLTSHAEIASTVSYLNKYYLQTVGLGDERYAGVVIDQLHPTFSRNSSDVIAQAVKDNIAFVQKQNAEGLRSTTLFQISNFDTTVNHEEFVTQVQKLWNDVRTGVAFGDMGYYGYGDKADIYALQQLSIVLSQIEDHGLALKIIDALEAEVFLESRSEKGEAGGADLDYNAIFKRDGLGASLGDENSRILGDGYTSLFTTLRSDVSTKANERAQNEENSNRLIVENSNDKWSACTDVACKENVINELEALETDDAIVQANKLRSNGFSYDPNKYDQLVKEQGLGIDHGKREYTRLLTLRIINKDEFDKLIDSAPLSAFKKELDTHITSNSGNNGAFYQLMLGSSGVDEANITSAMQGQLMLRVPLFAQEVRRLVVAEAYADKTLATDPTRWQAVIAEKAQFLANTPRFKLVASASNSGSYFAEDLHSTSHTSQFREVSNTGPAAGKASVEDYRRLDVNDIVNTEEAKKNFSISFMNPGEDFFLDGNLLESDVKAYLAGKVENISQRTLTLSKALGYTPGAFLVAQGRVYGIPKITEIEDLQDARGLDSLETGFMFDQISGRNYLLKQDFPETSATRITEIIDDRSKWRGDREWRIRSGEDTDLTLGGLVGYGQNPARLRAIEDYFGRDIKDISEKDQLDYMIVEMRSDFQDAYRIFMNPNATEAELQKAEQIFFGAKPIKWEPPVEPVNVFAYDGQSLTGELPWTSDLDINASNKEELKFEPYPLNWSPFGEGIPFNTEGLDFDFGSQQILTDTPKPTSSVAIPEVYSSDPNGQELWNLFGNTWPDIKVISYEDPADRANGTKLNDVDAEGRVFGMIRNDADSIHLGWLDKN